MGNFSQIGGVGILGYISPLNTGDTYPVIDPWYGIDGFRNLIDTSELDAIPVLRRRAGMVAGVSGGTAYYKLNPEPWSYTISDWSVFDSGSGTFITGGTFSSGTAYFTNNSGGTFSVTGFVAPDSLLTGFTYDNNNTFTLINGSGGTLSATFPIISGLTTTGDIIPSIDGTNNLGTLVNRFRSVNTLSGTSTLWTASTRLTTAIVDLGIDSSGNTRQITANNSIIQDDFINGGAY